MSDVTVIGLGAMGSTLARCLLNAGRQVTVWNRSAARAVPLAEAGATVAPSVAEAVAASPVTLINLFDHAAVQAVLAAPGVDAAVAGRDIVNLTTTVAEEAVATAAWARAAGASYLDGGIMAYPRHVGGERTAFLYSGDEAVFARNRALLAMLAGGQQFFGSDPGLAKTVYLALWSYYFTAMQGFFESMALASRLGVPLPGFSQLIAEGTTDLLSDGIRDAARRIVESDYGGEQATVDVHVDGSKAMLQAFAAFGVTARGLQAFDHTAMAAQAAGLGAQDLSVLFKILRPSDR